MLDDLAQVRDSLVEFTRMDIVVGVSVVPFFHSPPMEGVALHIAYHVFGIIQPAFLNVALRQPRAGFAVDSGLCAVKTTHIGECGGCLVERALMELRPAHEHPRLPKERVIFAAAQPFNVLLGLLAALCPLRPFLDAVLMNCLLRLLYGTVEVGLAQFAACLVANRVEGDKLGEVILVAVFLFQTSVYVSLRAIKICVVVCVEGMPPTTLGRIFLSRTSHGYHNQGNQKDGDNMSCLK